VQLNVSNNQKIVTNFVFSKNSDRGTWYLLLHNSNCASVFSCESNNPKIQTPGSGKSFTISSNFIRKRLSAIGRKKSFRPDDNSGDISKLAGEDTIPYLARLFDIAMSNNYTPGD